MHTHKIKMFPKIHITKWYALMTGEWLFMKGRGIEVGIK